MVYYRPAHPTIDIIRCCFIFSCTCNKTIILYGYRRLFVPTCKDFLPTGLDFIIFRLRRCYRYCYYYVDMRW